MTVGGPFMASRFLTEMEVVCVDDLACSGRGIWRLTKPLRYYSALLNRIIEVEPGFLTDFASVPRVPVAYMLFGDTSHKAAAIHDKLFHSHDICDEATANRVLLEASQAEGISWWRRTGIYLGVTIGGESSWVEDGKGNGHSIVNGRIV